MIQQCLRRVLLRVCLCVVAAAVAVTSVSVWCCSGWKVEPLSSAACTRRGVSRSAVVRYNGVSGRLLLFIVADAAVTSVSVCRCSGREVRL